MSESRILTMQPANATISIAEKLVSSDGFKSMFREGMALVEETASYLDGDGRTESRQLERVAALVYASESMRLTTRLMQLTSWLLLQRAVNEGELTREEAEREHRKVKINIQDAKPPVDQSDLLPPTLRDLNERSKRLMERIMLLDQQLHNEAAPVAHVGNPVADQLNALRSALKF